jgi:hypothetical protein
MKILRLWILVILAFVAVKTASSCSCAPTTAQKGVSRSDIVFRGELVAHKGRSAIFHVREYWKGNLESSVAVQWREGNHGSTK